jgi:hypothetical protein
MKQKNNWSVVEHLLYMHTLFACFYVNTCCQYTCFGLFLILWFTMKWIDWEVGLQAIRSVLIDWLCLFVCICVSLQCDCIVAAVYNTKQHRKTSPTKIRKLQINATKTITKHWNQPLETVKSNICSTKVDCDHVTNIIIIDIIF